MSEEQVNEDAMDGELLRTLIARDEELSSGAVKGRTHEEVMRAVRRAIEVA